MDAIATAFDPTRRNDDVMASFGYRLKGQFSTNEAHRRVKELEWLESLRQYKGLYDPTVQIEPGNSRVYPKLTRAKVNIVLSRLHEMLFPETDKNWEIDPSPDPTVDAEIVAEIVMSLLQQDPQTGQMVPPSEDDVRMGIKKYAVDACEKMSNVMDDQFVEMDYSEEVKKVLRSGLIYGTGIMKGIMLNPRVKRSWQRLPGGEYMENQTKEDIPFFEFTRIWDWYPDMSTTDVDKIEGSFERHVMTKHDLRQLVKRGDFYGDLIAQYMKDHPNGDYTAKNWEVDLQTIEVEAGSGTNTKTMTSSGTVVSEDYRSTNRQFGNKYQVLEYWGYVDGRDLEACGLDVPDVTLEYAANVWLLGNVPIKAVLYEGALGQYKVFYYEKDETSIFGEGLARIMRHSQIAIAAAARMVLDNGACVAGPQVEANISLLTPDTDYNSVYARKMWFREGKGIDAQYPALRSVEFNSHIPELLSIVEAFKQFGDEETTLPTWMMAQNVSNETAQATSSRMATITISIKDVVKNFDAFTEKIIADLYAWNMEFNPRKDIKGDFRCKARGVSSLVMKEIRMQALNQLSTTLTPEDWVYIPRREFLIDKFKAHDINIKLRTEEEAAKIREEEQNSIQMQLAIEMQKAEIGYKKSQTMAQLTKAKEKNVEANVKAQAPPEQQEQVDPRLQDEQVALATTERMSKAAQMRREDEAHQQEMVHKEDEHALKIASDASAAAQELGIKKQKAEHDMKIKAEASKAAAQAKKAAANKPKAGIKKEKSEK
ncbi:MAG TPA: hypothetical protein PLW50_00765 [Smithellaceae bacterium]|nr:hypothetical protein [Smithellaceae bacterium]